MREFAENENATVRISDDNSVDISSSSRDGKRNFGGDVCLLLRAISGTGGKYGLGMPLDVLKGYNTKT